MTDTVIECDCGAQVRLPAESASRQFRCPKCETGVALTHDVQALSAVRLKSIELPSDQAGPLCPICQTEIEADEFCVNCPGCQQTHHRECWSEIGGCGTYGCQEAPAVEKAENTAATPLAAWGDTKKCPACGEEIKSIALRCRYCKTDFETVDPLSVADLHRQVVRDEKADSLQKSLVATFVGSLIGCLALIMLIVSCTLVLPNRERLKKCGPLYMVMGYASLGLSAIYTLLMFFFFIGQIL